MFPHSPPPPPAYHAPHAKPLSHRPRHQRALQAAALCGLLVALAACGPRARNGGFDSENPAAKLHAIHDAGLSLDQTKVPELVAQLDSADPAVRLLSIQSLERITGTRLGYKPYDEPADRQPAVDRWRAKLVELTETTNSPVSESKAD